MRAVVRGGGSIGIRHADVLRSLGARVDVWPVRPRPQGAPGFVAGEDAEGLARYDEADLVVIATDTSRHVSDVVEALDHGARLVLAEKPIAPSMADAASLAAHPRAEAVGVAAPLRAHEGFRVLAQAVDSLQGRLSASVRCQSWLPDWRPGTDYRRSYSARPAEGGVLRDLIHEIDYAMVLFGAPRLVGSVLDFDGPLDIEADQAASLLWTTDRATVAARLDYVTRPSSRGVVVEGSFGGVEWDIARSTVTVSGADGDREVTWHERDRDRNAVMATQARAFLEHGGLEAVDRSTRLAAGCPATLVEGLAAVGVCDQARSADAARRRLEEGHLG